MGRKKQLKILTDAEWRNYQKPKPEFRPRASGKGRALHSYCEIAGCGKYIETSNLSKHLKGHGFRGRTHDLGKSPERRAKKLNARRGEASLRAASGHAAGRHEEEGERTRNEVDANHQEQGQGTRSEVDAAPQEQDQRPDTENEKVEREQGGYVAVATSAFREAIRGGRRRLAVWGW